ncbi:hypothetical protein NPJ88_000490 [Halomonas elongata]|uniref:hypothetical protein n=1 Tax=Halomonas elongata TaxID=2746 RepID=UPI00255A9876|nr:hypothetical protein [Halomonas elongata]MDL4860801.1 hypothetical protein [Halomonas elongata]
MAGGWSKSLAGFINQVEKDVVTLRNRIVGEALQMLQMGSPVQDGVYRGNHLVSVGSPDDSYDLDYQGSSAPKGSVDQEAYKREIAKLALEFAPFTTVYIQNNLPYAQKIEDGHSEQAGHGVYSVAVNNLEEKYGR